MLNYQRVCSFDFETFFSTQIIQTSAMDVMGGALDIASHRL